MAVFAGLLGFIALIVVMLGAFSWLVMLALGALGHIFSIELFYISYASAVIVTICLSIIGSFFRR